MVKKIIMLPLALMLVMHAQEHKETKKEAPPVDYQEELRKAILQADTWKVRQYLKRPQINVNLQELDELAEDVLEERRATIPNEFEIGIMVVGTQLFAYCNLFLIMDWWQGGYSTNDQMNTIRTWARCAWWGCLLAYLPAIIGPRWRSWANQRIKNDFTQAVNAKTEPT